MGYTHYWSTNPNVTEKQFTKFVDAVKKLHANLPEKTETAGGSYADEVIVICGGDGSGSPVLGENYCYNNHDYGRTVIFNGNEDKGLDHETFFISEKPNRDGDFCKTARKPYDLFVCACLIAAGKFLKYKLRTDGTVNDWKEAFAYYSAIMGTEQPDEPARYKLLQKKPVTA